MDEEEVELRQRLGALAEAVPSSADTERSRVAPAVPRPRMAIQWIAVLSIVVVGWFAVVVAAGTPRVDPTPGVAGATGADSPSPASTLARSTFTPTPRQTAIDPTIEPTATPSPPPDLERVVEVVHDDLRVHLELERNPLPAGERSWARVSVTNEGTDDVNWLHGGCAIPVNTMGRSEVAWPMGSAQAGDLDHFKRSVLDGNFARDPSPYATFLFVEEENLTTGTTSCSDMAFTETVKPGERVEKQLWWSGLSSPNRAMPPTGPVEIIGNATYFGRDPEPASIVDHVIEISLQAWIVNDGPNVLSPAQAVDAALRDLTFAQAVDENTSPRGNASGTEEIAWYDPVRAIWEIGIVWWHRPEGPWIEGVIVDGRSGAVVGDLDRAWVQDVDPFP
jgi:hypothetical protein